MLVKQRQRINLKCDGCIKPAARRLALFQAKDEYECYAESYVKCFWGLCDMHKSNEDIISAPDLTEIADLIKDKILSCNRPTKITSAALSKCWND